MQHLGNLFLQKQKFKGNSIMERSVEALTLTVSLIVAILKSPQ